MIPIFYIIVPEIDRIIPRMGLRRMIARRGSLAATPDSVHWVSMHGRLQGVDRVKEPDPELSRIENGIARVIADMYMALGGLWVRRPDQTSRGS